MGSQLAVAYSEIERPDQQYPIGYMSSSKTAPIRSGWKRPRTRWLSWLSRNTLRWPPWTYRARSHNWRPCRPIQIRPR